MAKKLGKLGARYARALFKAAEQELGTSGEPTPAQILARELQQFASLWREQREFRMSVLSPMFTSQGRRQALLLIAEKAGVAELGQKFLGVVFDRDRMNGLEEIIDAFSALADQNAGVVLVRVTTANPISMDEKKNIEQSLSQHVGGKPGFSWQIDPEILGGMVVEFGGRVLDGSLSGRLSKMEQTLGLSS